MRTFPRTCAGEGCEVTLVRHGDPVPDGAREHEARGMCASCYSAERRGGRQRMRQGERPDACLECERPLRTRTEDRPGAVEHAGRGLCTTCVSRRRWEATHVRQRQRRPRACRSCDRELRPSGAAPIEGTVRHAADGLCGACYERRGRRERALIGLVQEAMP